MKNILLGLVLIISLHTQAQDSTKQSIKTAIDAKRYSFQPINITTSSGRLRQLDLGYFLRVNGDTLKVNLPYFGRAYSAPIDPSDAGFDFTSTNFTYTVSPGKKNSHNISIKTKDRTYNTEFTLTVYDNGTAYLRASGSDREPVSYNGNLKEAK